VRTPGWLRQFSWVKTLRVIVGVRNSVTSLVPVLKCIARKRLVETVTD
jgi:hypothetical protein